MRFLTITDAPFHLYKSRDTSLPRLYVQASFTRSIHSSFIPISPFLARLHTRASGSLATHSLSNISRSFHTGSSVSLCFLVYRTCMANTFPFISCLIAGYLLAMRLKTSWTSLIDQHASCHSSLHPLRLLDSFVTKIVFPHEDPFRVAPTHTHSPPHGRRFPHPCILYSRVLSWLLLGIESQPPVQIQIRCLRLVPCPYTFVLHVLVPTLGANMHSLQPSDRSFIKAASRHGPWRGFRDVIRSVLSGVYVLDTGSDCKANGVSDFDSAETAVQIRRLREEVGGEIEND